MLKESPSSVLEFWFGKEYDSCELNSAQLKRWFKKQKATDQEIQKRFSELVELAASDQVGWPENDAQSPLALIIALDQFPRNIARGTSRMYSYDDKACSYATELVQSGAHLQYKPVERIFIYLPFEHAEDLALQDKAVHLFTGLRDEVPEKYRVAYTRTLEYAIAHQRVIRQFGRFPHRNKILNRKSSPEEESYLAQPGSGF